MTNFWQDLPRPFFILAPMEAVTDVVFRHVVAAAAKPDLFFTEFTNASSYASEKGNFSTRGRLTFTEDEQPMVAQIWGNRPDQFAFMAKGLAKQGFAGIDINMGCPAKDVVKKDAGSGLIKKPELAAELIAAAKQGGLPVSVKTRLGYSSTDEWRDWLTHILQQDIANLTIHLRTRKEMSKVPAHFEFIPEIKKLRDQIAPQTLLTINGDIRDRQHGLELAEKCGIDGIMIGRGIFQNPFAFKAHSSSSQRQNHAVSMSSNSTSSFQKHLQPELQATPGPELKPGAKPFLETRKLESEVEKEKGTHSKEELLALLHLHLDLFDKYTTELGPRHFDPLKRFFKIYVRDFPGASELREKLMHTKNTDEVRKLLKAQ